MNKKHDVIFENSEQRVPQKSKYFSSTEEKTLKKSPLMSTERQFEDFSFNSEFAFGISGVYTGERLDSKSTKDSVKALYEPWDSPHTGTNVVLFVPVPRENMNNGDRVLEEVASFLESAYAATSSPQVAVDSTVTVYRPVSGRSSDASGLLYVFRRAKRGASTGNQWLMCMDGVRATNTDDSEMRPTCIKGTNLAPLVSGLILMWKERQMFRISGYKFRIGDFVGVLGMLRRKTDQISIVIEISCSLPQLDVLIGFGSHLVVSLRKISSRSTMSSVCSDLMECYATVFPHLL